MSDAISACRAAARETSIIFRRLMDYYSADEADAWLNSQHPQLEWQTPIDVIASAQAGRVYAVLDRLDADGYI